MTTEDIIRAAIERCDRVVAGVAELRPILDPVLPFAGGDLTVLPFLERTASIALLKRYEQLQDLLGRAFRAYLSWEGYDVQEMTRRDQANALEKFGIVADADAWMATAELRNRLVHEYPLDEKTQVTRVNDCWSAIADLIATYERLRAHITQKGLI